MQEIREPINERSTRVLRVSFTVDDGGALPAALVSSLTATLRDETTGTVIRAAESVLGAHGGVLTDGTLTLTLTEADTQALGTAALQARVLTLDLRTSGGLRITEEVRYLVRALADIA